MRRLYLPVFLTGSGCASHPSHEREADGPRPRMRTDHGTDRCQHALNGSQLTRGFLEQLPRLTFCVGMYRCQPDVGLALDLRRNELQNARSALDFVRNAVFSFDAAVLQSKDRLEIEGRANEPCGAADASTTVQELEGVYRKVDLRRDRGSVRRAVLTSPTVAPACAALAAART